MTDNSIETVRVPDPRVLGAQRTADIIADWISAEIAEMLELPVSEIDPDGLFLEVGLSSVQAVEISDSLQRWLGRDLPPTLAYDYPTINAVAAYLVEELSGTAAG
ncbi:acyl carrier protein [Nocardia harenae]|uniref:acyl carrier protein n=1 Tax=Nocardia harenae TaxID=358707 RepID=UPI00082BF309|nr:acyl carrier protein [Nocardia harenae]